MSKTKRYRHRGSGPRQSGRLDILSTGHGDLRITITEGDEAEVAKARAMIEDMLARGYSIFVEVEGEDMYGRPMTTTRRARRFDPKRMVYIVDDTPPPPKDEPRVPNIRAGAKGRRRAERAVPVTGSRATAVGRSSGG